MRRFIIGAASAATAALAASPVWAQVCATERPDWDGAPVGRFADLIAVLTTPFGLGLIIVGCVAMMLGRSALLALAAAIFAAAAAFRYVYADALLLAAAQEGCAPNPATTSFVFVAIALAMAALAWLRKRAGA